ncbi:MAG: hypothetical protein ACXQS6_06410 [Candidatus Syntropharchaeales archaeon]|nr:hypothetical protein [Candidatus Syntrophoarchaeum sp.]
MEKWLDTCNKYRVEFDSIDDSVDWYNRTNATYELERLVEEKI